MIAEALGYMAAVLFCGAGAALVAAGWSLKRTLTFDNLYFRVAAYAIVLGALWPIAANNRFDVWVPDGRSVPIALVLLNALTWIQALTEVVAWFMCYNGNPTPWSAYDLTVWVVYVCVGTLAVVGFSNESTRFLALLLVAPLALLFGWVATLQAHKPRRIWVSATVEWQKPLEWMRQQHYAALYLVAVGLGTLLFEMLGPSYGNALGHGWAAGFMLVEHVALGALLLFLTTSFAADFEHAPTDDKSDVQGRVDSMEINVGDPSLLTGFDD